MSRMTDLNKLLRNDFQDHEEKIELLEDMAEYYNELIWKKRKYGTISSDEYIEELKLVTELIDEADALRHLELDEDDIVKISENTIVKLLRGE